MKWCDSKCAEIILEKCTVPLVVAAVGWVGVQSANNIADKFNKASIIKEFLPKIVDGSPSERAIAMIALNEYLTPAEKAEIEWRLISTFQIELLEAADRKDESKLQEVKKTFRFAYPGSFKNTADLQVDKYARSNPIATELMNKLKNDPVKLEYFKNSLSEHPDTPKN